MRSFLMLAVCARMLLAQSTPDVRGAVKRALPVLQHSAAAFVEQRACVSCHHNILPVFVLHAAELHGFEIDRKVLAAVEEKTFRGLRNPGALDDAIQAAALN